MGDDELGRVPPRLRRADLIVVGALVLVGGAVMLVVLAVDGIGLDAWVLAILTAVATVVVLGSLLAVRDRRPDDGAVLATARRRVLEPSGSDLDAPRADQPGVTAAAADEDEVIDLDAEEGLVTRVALRPGPIWRRRLAERPDLWWIVATSVGLDVPGWLLHQRPRTIDPRDVVTIPWTAIDRFRVRADRDGPDTYDITGHGAGGRPEHWWVCRREITDEVTLLDHVRTVGRVTIQLEDSIRS